MRFLFVTFDGGGNMVPQFGLAHELRERGHQVTFLGGGRERVERRGYRYLAYSDRSDRVTSQAELFELFFGIGIARDTARSIESVRADAVVVDCLLAGALAAAEHAGLPFAALFHALYQPFIAGDFEKQWSWLMPAINETRTVVGVEPVGSDAELFGRADRALVATLEEFDFPFVERPQNVRYLGPIFEDDEAGAEPAASDDERRVLVSLSTTDMPSEHKRMQEQLLVRVVLALGDLPVRGLVTLGGSDDAWPQATKNVVVGGYVPHATVLPQAELVVCHAGLWTVMTALRYGVPLLCAPLGRDQPNNASRVEAVGAGRVLRPDADVPTIREALVQVLADESYRKAASRMEAAIASSGGAAAAADELESLVAG